MKNYEMPMNLFNQNVDLRHYYDQQMRAWFGEVRPLRLEGAGRFFTPPPAMPLRAVFVPPALSRTYMQATPEEPDLESCFDILTWLNKAKRVVVLGDPGCGKSTLVSWLTWRLCAGLTEPLPAWCSGILPVPMVLRDMALREVRNLDDLVESHIQTDLIAGHPSLGAAWSDVLRTRIREAPESLLFLVDGLDELPSALQEPVRDALRSAMLSLPETRFVITSRIVGYEQNALDSPIERSGGEFGESTKFSPVSREIQRLYVTPFDDKRIRQFSKNWFLHGEYEQRRGDAYVKKFINGLFADPVALQLGRIPNLLVMAAQVFGITNTLPDGRAKLYGAITKAYLESIDQLYGLGDSRFSFEQKSSWLAAVGYWMQLRRGGLTNAGENTRELLATESEVADWLTHAMQESGLTADATYIKSFVDAIARRSGLFIPRGDGLYAFAHLSIQEYFAALYLHRRVRQLALTDARGLTSQKRQLAQLAKLAAWRETLVTFFELPEWLPQELPTLFDAVFGKNFDKVPSEARRRGKREFHKPTNSILVELLARLMVNPSIPAREDLRQIGLGFVMRYLIHERANADLYAINSSSLSVLTANESGSAFFWDWLVKNPRALLNSRDGGGMDLSGLRARDYSPLALLKNLRWLNMNQSTISDLSPLATMDKLTELDLGFTSVRSLEPLGTLSRLKDLNLIGVPIADLSPLGSVVTLEALWLSGSPVTDISPLKKCIGIEKLYLGCHNLEDISPLSKLKNLKQLWLAYTLIGDVGPLAELTKLKRLDVSGSPVKNLTVLSHLESLLIIKDDE